MSGSAHAEESRTRSTTDEPTSRPRLLWRTARRYASVRGLCVLAALALVGDLVTTVYGLRIGLQEQNPFVLRVLAEYGVAGLVGLKLVAVGWVVVIWSGLGRRYGVAAVAGLMLPQLFAVVVNVVTILTA